MEYTFEKILSFLNNEDCKLGQTRSYPEIEVPFELRGRDFFDLAVSDLNAEYKHHLINATSNVKRALECQMDELIIRLGYTPTQRRKLNFPEKIIIMQDFGFVAPRLLKKVNDTRNKLEHSYKIPKKEQVEDYLDFTEIFITLLSNLYNKIPISATVLSKNDRNFDQLYFHFSPESNELIIKDKWSIFEDGIIISSSDPDGTERQKKIHESKEVFKLNFGSKEYFDLLKPYYRLIKND